jgi:hypothetical protein
MELGFRRKGKRTENPRGLEKNLKGSEIIINLRGQEDLKD